MIAVAFSKQKTEKEENAVTTSGILPAMQPAIQSAFLRDEALQEGHLQTGKTARPGTLDHLVKPKLIAPATTSSFGVRAVAGFYSA